MTGNHDIEAAWRYHNGSKHPNGDLFPEPEFVMVEDSIPLKRPLVKSPIEETERPKLSSFTSVGPPFEPEAILTEEETVPLVFIKRI